MTAMQAISLSSVRGVSLRRALRDTPRQWKRLVLAAADILCLMVAFWAAFALRVGELWPTPYLAAAAPLFLIVPPLAIAVFWYGGVYNTLLRSLERRSTLAIARCVAATSIVVAVLPTVLPSVSIPRSVPIIFAMVCLIFVVGFRFAAQTLFRTVTRRAHGTEPVIIYGAGAAGRQLVAALDAGAEYNVIAFIDDDAGLSGHNVAGRRVYPPSQIPKVAQQYNVRRALLALPSINVQRRRKILMRLSKMQMIIQTVPSAPEILSGRASVDSLRDASVQDLLGRSEVDPNLSLLSAPVSGQTVMVTGAGGSIGSELCRQIINLKPSQLVLYEISEHALYSIEQELYDALAHSESAIAIEAVLGSVYDEVRFARTIREYSVDTIFHAAAYKHVPMVEKNMIEGLRNNVLGAHVVAHQSGSAGVKRIILVSTDKAVRPTNVMGASKRWAELIFQAAQAQYRNSTFAMVRFGNVLGSSGSVIPRFEYQIRQGGPVTVTHPEINRYFMSIPEAAQLVIQAGALASGGEVFLLDMGSPMRIADLARHMIALHGLTVRDEQKPDGDIEIIYTGLRPGEKLYEELLIADDPKATPHPKIFRAEERSISFDIVEDAISALRASIAAGNSRRALSTLQAIVEEYSRSSKVGDLTDRVVDVDKASVPRTSARERPDLRTGSHSNDALGQAASL